MFWEDRHLISPASKAEILLNHGIGNWIKVWTLPSVLLLIAEMVLTREVRIDIVGNLNCKEKTAGHDR